MSTQTKNTKPVDNDPNSWKNREVGAIWQNENSMMMRLKNKEGNEIKFIILKNKWKEDGSKQPDFRVYKDVPQATSAPTQNKKSAKVEKPVQEPEEEFV